MVGVCVVLISTRMKKKENLLFRKLDFNETEITGTFSRVEVWNTSIDQTRRQTRTIVLIVTF